MADGDAGFAHQREETTMRIPAIRVGPGARIGDWIIRDEIGRGGNGVVYEAIHLARSERVAIKVLAQELVDDGVALARFLREARMLARLSSPHVVRPIDVGMIPGGAPYIVMELLEGHDLASIVDRLGAVPLDDALDWIAQACDAIGEAHSAGIVHRDLTLANLWAVPQRSGSTTIKVLDFGLAKQTKISPSDGQTSLTLAGSVFGTPYFMPPEQILELATVDARGDVWSLGVCLYRLVLGVYPFGAESPSSTCLRVIACDYPSPREVRPDLPVMLEELFARCFQKRPEHRFRDARALGIAIARARRRALSMRAPSTLTRIHVAPNLRTED